jgi:acyl-CoA thioester hydrolase
MAEADVSGWFDGRTHILPVRVYYEDTDFSGVVYHANYLKFFERGRSDFLRLIGVHHGAYQARTPGLAFAVTEINVKFIRPASIDNILHVQTRFHAIKGPRMLVAQVIRRGQDVLAEAQVTACTIQLDGKVARPPRDLQDTLRPLLDPET